MTPRSDADWWSGREPHSVEQLWDQGWPEDVAEQIAADERGRLSRGDVTDITGAQRHLGVTRSAVDKLVSDGKLRLITFPPLYTNDKPKKRIPLVDVARLLDSHSSD